MINDASGPKLDAINTTLEGIGYILSSIHEEGVNNTTTLQNHSQVLKDLTIVLTSNADNEQIYDLQQAMDKLHLDVAANTTTITDLQSTVAGLFTSVTDLFSKVDVQNGLLIKILAQLKTHSQPSPSFAAENRHTLQMAIEFGVLTGVPIEDLEVQVAGLAMASTSTPS
ncbi:hypothetical protein L6452_40348 [Arctium lappa]|uniref:Uncharacterized protein n=1 Tax=Arctium lappa TaxID=4217 RepID=A0ACB8XQT1_ARCLA|nr:hypothetical protein L6452_40348 [Arctium lappa]